MLKYHLYLLQRLHRAADRRGASQGSGSAESPFLPPLSSLSHIHGGWVAPRQWHSATQDSPRHTGSFYSKSGLQQARFCDPVMPRFLFFLQLFISHPRLPLGWATKLGVKLRALPTAVWRCGKTESKVRGWALAIRRSAGGGWVVGGWHVLGMQ